MAENGKYRVYSDVEWLYPDTVISEYGNKAELHSARGADVDFQVLCDLDVCEGDAFSVTTEGIVGEIVVYQLGIAHVSLNSAVNSYTTDDYESVRDFVTRKAPFDIYDVTYELSDRIAKSGRLGFFVRVNVAADEKPGIYDGSITIRVGEDSLRIPVSLRVYETVVPSLRDAEFHMTNWLYYTILAEQNGVEPYSDEYRTLLANYMKNQLDMRSDYLMIPRGEPIRDAEGRVVDFDFTAAEYVGKLAIYLGFNVIMGGFPATFVKWDGPDLFLHWDQEITVSSIEGFRQLKLYFERACECVERNGWESKYQQCLVDEPQFTNSHSYRAISAICRQIMPGIVINDPVETTEIGGALDIWAVKQAVYEKHYEKFRMLQDLGEEMWIYSCGFPAGKVMNHVMDIPLTASRLIFWMCYKYDCTGFLHFGYHRFSEPDENGIIDGCYTTRPERPKFPAGNGHVVYPGKGKPEYSVRGHAQRCGMLDFELFGILGRRDEAKAKSLIERVARSFSDYDESAVAFDEVRRELLECLG